ncbi:MAG TPA: phasin family protein [Novosphingobium sp.]|nr:phasin family protein [Novosphingobium sp.]
MAGNEDDKDKAIAEKAYAAAASSNSEKGKTVPTDVEPAAKVPASASAASIEGKPQTPVAKTENDEAPKAQEARSAVPASEVSPAPKPKAAAVVKASPKSEAVVKAKAKPAGRPKSAIKTPTVPAATAPMPKSARIAPVAAAKPAVAAAQPVPAAPKDVSGSKAAPKTADITSPLFAGLFTNFLLEEQTMDMSANFNGLQDAVTEAQAKAKAAFEKSTAVLGEISEFTKGNVEAVMESGKILADGVQGFGSELVAEGRSTFETITGDIKELAAAKSPTDFFKIQSDMMRKNFDSAVAYGSKNSEAVLKLVSDAMAPISGRISLAMEKVRQPSL